MFEEVNLTASYRDIGGLNRGRPHIMSRTPVSLLERLRAMPQSKDWERLVDIYDPFIRKWINRAGVHSSDVDDLTQEILTELVSEISKFEHSGRTGAFRLWLRTFVVYRVLRYRRARVASALDEREIDSLEDPDSALSKAWDEEHDQHVLARLISVCERSFSQTSWAAFRMLTMEELPANEVGQRLGISPNAALIAKSRILRRLRSYADGLIDEFEV